MPQGNLLDEGQKNTAGNFNYGQNTCLIKPAQIS